MTSEQRVEWNGLRVVNDCTLLVKLILTLTEEHKDYNYTLNPQIIRAALSVGSNVVEGSRRSNKEFRRFLDIAIGSCDEVKFQLQFYKENQINILCDKIIGQLVNLKKSRCSEL
jgi:four helix bundle protein